jgi:tRNA A37 N6-isopentenylltransferase MiaA
MKLQTARQGKNESPQEFAERCRALVQKITCKVGEPVAQRVHQENAERMILASFVSGLTGVPGRQVRYANPQTVQQALQIALPVQEAEKQERFNSSFYTRFDNSASLESRPQVGHKVRVKGQNIRAQLARPVTRTLSAPQFQ